jgi:hypothetical protein
LVVPSRDCVSALRLQDKDGLTVVYLKTQFFWGCYAVSTGKYTDVSRWLSTYTFRVRPSFGHGMTTQRS